MFQNYIFDLYGTLIDINTNEWNIGLWKKMAEFYGFYGAEYTPKELKEAYFDQCRIQEEKLQKKVGVDYAEIKVEKVFKKLFSMKSVDMDMKTCKVACKFFRIISTKYIKLYDGVEELLDLLHSKGKKVYLLSNAQQVFTEYEMILLGIHDKFDGLVFSSNEKCRKPSTTFFDIVLERYNLKKEESIMIGNDPISDIKGAYDSGLKSLYIHTNISPGNLDEDTLLSDYTILDGDVKKIKDLIIKK